MRFNLLNINQGDSKNSIIDKINYNFSQLVAFSSSAEGRIGQIGPTGYSGSAGLIGLTGATGTRGTVWAVSSVEPDSPQEYDVWIDQDEPRIGQVYQYLSGVWEDTGINLIERDYFDIEPDVQTIFGGTDFSAIYLAGQDQNSTSLVISDSENSSTYLNPNYSKFLISTSDQTDKPILSFRRRSNTVNSEPSFYWGQSGNSANLSLRSSYGISFSSGKTLFLGNGSTGSVFLSGRNLNGRAVTSIFLNTKNGSSSSINLSAVNQISVYSSNLLINESLFYFRQYNVAVWGSVSLTSPIGDSHHQGIVVERGGTSTSPMVYLGYSNSVTNGTIPTGASTLRDIFKVRQTIGNTTGETDQVIRGALIFGGTGSSVLTNPSGPTGSWSYHVRGNLGTTTQGVGTVTLRGTSYDYVDLTPTSYYLNDFITVKLSNKTWLGGSNVYLKIPSVPVLPPPSNYYPLIDENYVSNYRILLNFGTDPNIKIYGVIWEQNYAASIFGNSTAGYVTQVKVFDNPCYYIDLTYYFNPNSQEVWAFVKTCDGKSYPLLITDVNGGANGGVPS